MRDVICDLSDVLVRTCPDRLGLDLVDFGTFVLGYFIGAASMFVALAMFMGSSKRDRDISRRPPTL